MCAFHLVFSPMRSLNRRLLAPHGPDRVRHDKPIRTFVEPLPIFLIALNRSVRALAVATLSLVNSEPRVAFRVAHYDHGPFRRAVLFGEVEVYVVLPVCSIGK